MPVMGQPVTLALLRQALIDRCYLDVADPRLDSGNLNRILNEAMQRFDVASPTGWPWHWVTTSTTVVQFQDGFEFTLGTPNTVHKVSYVLIGDTGGLWQYPIERMTREEQLERYPRDSDQSIPQTWAVGGWADGWVNGEPNAVIWLRPVPNQAYQLTFAGWQLIPEFTADSDPNPGTTDRMIGDWNAAIIEYAAALVYRAADDLSEAVSALTDFQAQVLNARRTKRRTIGAGVPNFPGSANATGGLG